MSPKNLQQSCTYCSGNHTKVSKCAQYRQDSVMAEYISDLDFTCKTKQNMLHLISKNILRLAVILFERGRRYNKDLHDSIVIVPSTQRSKPLSKFTKNQLIRRLVQLSKDFASQINTIVARKRQEAERQEAEQNVCPICLDPIENQAQCTSPCGHTFCSPCFIRNISSELSRGNTAKCPCCRRTTVEVRNIW
jgi:hypothetical protein